MIFARRGGWLWRSSGTPGSRPGKTRFGAHSTPSSPTGSNSSPRTVPNRRVRTDTGRRTFPSRSPAGSPALTPVAVAVAAARLYSRRKSARLYCSRAAFASSPYMPPRSPRSQARPKAFAVFSDPESASEPTSRPATSATAAMPAIGADRWDSRHFRSGASRNTRRAKRSLGSGGRPAVRSAVRVQPGLDHRGLRGADGRLGLFAGADRRSVLAGRLRGRRLPRLAHRAALPVRGVPLAVRAVVRPAERDLLRRRARFDARGRRLPPARQDRRQAWRPRRARRCRPGRLPRPGAGLGRRRGGAAASGRARVAQADPALGDPERAEPPPAAVRAAAEGARSLRSLPQDRGSAARGGSAQQ